MLTYAQALALIGSLDLIPATETLPLAATAGRVLAADVRLAGDQPPFDRATMDGYALRLAGEATHFRVVATVHAGERFAGELQPGEAVRIMTGAPVPAGATVVPHELTDRGAETVTITDAAALRPGRNTARRGEDGRAGAIIAAAGTRLTPVVLAAAAMAGAATATVARAPRLAVVTTGDEVGGQGDAAIHDSNGPFMAGFAAALGLGATRRHAPDTGDRLRNALREAADEADIVVTSGGVSAGDKDLVPALAAELGFATVFHHLAMQPGKPVLLARQGAGRFLVGLPGNPVSVLATAHLVLWPLIRRFLGAPPPAWLELPLTMPWQHRGNRQLFLPARLATGGIEPLRWNGSGDLLAAAAGDGLVDLAPGAVLAAGAPARFLPYVGGALGERGLLPARAPA
jgi:molybdopterin molybdotransferase